MPTESDIDAGSEAAHAVEALSLRAAASLAEPARRTFDSLSASEQLRLASEVARSRRHDFTRMIDNVVNVVGGLRRRRSADGDEAIHYEPCVVFFVKRKWDSLEPGEAPGQQIPKALLSHAVIAGVKTLCAVPTDVQLQDRLIGVKAQCKNAIFAQTPGGPGGFGALACVVQDDNDTPYALSAIHVLSPVLDPANNGVSEGAQAFAVKSDATPPEGLPYLRATSFGGRLVREPATSFDVQWAEVVDGSIGRLRTALDGLNLSSETPFVESPAALVDLLNDGRRMLVLVPANHHRFLNPPRTFPQATLSLDEAEQVLDYELDDGSAMRVVHSVIELQVQAGERTESGDSGCPVVIPLDSGGFALVGMHIAGNKAFRTSFVVPAWKLFDPFVYAEFGGVLPDGGLRIRQV